MSSMGKQRYPQFKHVARNYEMSKPPRLKESKERKQHLMAHREGAVSYHPPARKNLTQDFLDIMKLHSS